MGQPVLHVIAFPDDGHVTTSGGADAVSAVENHYALLDMYCAPSDPDLREVFTVMVYAIPAELEDAVSNALDDLSGDEGYDYLESLGRTHPMVQGVPVDVVYTMDGASAKLAEPEPTVLG